MLQVKMKSLAEAACIADVSCDSASTQMLVLKISSSVSLILPRKNQVNHSAACHLSILLSQVSLAQER